MRFNCDSCGQRYDADDSFAGEDVECSKCGATISVPNSEPTPELTIKAVQPLNAEPKAPKLTMPSSTGQNTADQKTEGTSEKIKAPSLSMPASVAQKTPEQKTEGVSDKIKAPSLSIAALAMQNASTPKAEEVQEKKETSGLSIPVSSGKEMDEQDVEKASGESAGDCPNCGAALQSATAVICTNCGHNLKMGMNVNTLKKAKTAGKLGLAIGAGAGAAILSGVLWAAIAVWLKLEIGWIACLVGLITGAVVCLVTPERSARMGALAVGLAVVGMLCGKMLTAEYLLRDTFKSFSRMTEKLTKGNNKFGKQLQDVALMGMLTNEMRESGEISDPYKNDDLKKLAPKKGEKPSKAYNEAWKKAGILAKRNMDKVKKKFASLSKKDKARLQKNLDRMFLAVPLYQEMVDNGEIPKLDKSYKELAPKSFKDKPSKEYLEAFKKYSIQYAENMKKVRKKLYSLSDEEAERLKNNVGSSISNQISYWQKLKMVTSYWDILWFLLAISTAWGLGNGTSSLSRQDL